MSTPNPTHIIAGHYWREYDRTCGCLWRPDSNPVDGGKELHAAHVVSKLTDAGYSIVHHRPTCAAAGDSCKHLPECVMAICVCGEEWPCPTVAAAAEEDQ